MDDYVEERPPLTKRVVNIKRRTLLNSVPDARPGIGAAEQIDAWTNRKVEPCIPTGITALDEAIGGLPVKQITAVLADTGVGKSELCRQIGRRAARKGHAVIHVDRELGQSRIVTRQVAQDTEIPSYVFADEQPTFSQEQLVRYRKMQKAYARKWKHYSLYIPPLGIALSDLTKKLDLELAAIATEKPSVIILDSLQRFAEGVPVADIRVQVQTTMRWAEGFVRERNVALIIPSEVSRPSDNKKRKGISAGAESRAIEFTSDVVLYLEERFQGPRDAERIPEGTTVERRVSVTIEKARDGARGTLPDDLVFIEPHWDMKTRKAPPPKKKEK